MGILSTTQSLPGEYVPDQVDLSINQLAIAAPKVPSVFTLELTTACNNFCSGCANIQLARNKKDRKHHSLVFLDDWKTLIDNIAPFARIIRLSGGEPTLHPQFIEIVKYIDTLKIPHSLFSTGLWRASQAEKIIKLYKKSNYFVGMLISLHGANSNSHNAFVENTDAAFNTTCRNIRAVAEQGIEVFTNTVLTKYNCSEIEQIMQLSVDMQAKYAIFNRFLGDRHPIEADVEQLKAAIIQIDSLKKQGYKCRFGNNIPPCFVNNSSEGAKAGYQLCHIDPRGFVRPDNLINLNFGNIYQMLLSDIWQSPIATMYRSSFPKSCLTCAAFDVCKAGAKSVSLQYGLHQDRLMTAPLNHFISDRDDDKNNIKYLALTSD